MTRNKGNIAIAENILAVIVRSLFPMFLLRDGLYDKEGFICLFMLLVFKA